MASNDNMANITKWGVEFSKKYQKDVHGDRFLIFGGKTSKGWGNYEDISVDSWVLVKKFFDTDKYESIVDGLEDTELYTDPDWFCPVLPNPNEV